jgi:hypothetical protein
VLRVVEERERTKAVVEVGPRRSKALLECGDRLPEREAALTDEVEVVKVLPRTPPAAARSDTMAPASNASVRKRSRSTESLCDRCMQRAVPPAR